LLDDDMASVPLHLCKFSVHSCQHQLEISVVYSSLGSYNVTKLTFTYVMNRTYSDVHAICCRHMAQLRGSILVRVRPNGGSSLLSLSNSHHSGIYSAPCPSRITLDHERVAPVMPSHNVK
jgi:hypothetical protein